MLPAFGWTRLLVLHFGENLIIRQTQVVFQREAQTGKSLSICPDPHFPPLLVELSVLGCCCGVSFLACFRSFEVAVFCLGPRLTCFALPPNRLSTSSEDMTWCKRALSSTAGSEQKDGAVIGLSYGIEQRDLWSEIVTGPPLAHRCPFRFFCSKNRWPWFTWWFGPSMSPKRTSLLQPGRVRPLQTTNRGMLN